MKNTFFLLIVLAICLSSFSQNQAVIGFPEYKLLYRGHHNIIECAMNDADSTYITCRDDQGTISALNYTDANGETACFDVMVYYNVSSFELVVHAIKNNNDYIVRKETFRVKDAPYPVIVPTTISHSVGIRVDIHLSNDSPISNATFVVTGGTIDDIPFSGNLVPGSIVAKVKPGKKVAIEVFYTLNGVKASTPAQGILTVTN